MSPKAFIAAVAREILSHFAKAGDAPHSAVRGWLAQFWWGDDRTVHYEIAVHDRTLRLELGLHFESTPERNRALLTAFERHIIEVQAALGDTVWVEDWDRGWSRVYETIPLMPLDDARVYAVAGRLCEIMEYLQPMLELLDGAGDARPIANA